MTSLGMPIFVFDLIDNIEKTFHPWHKRSGIFLASYWIGFYGANGKITRTQLDFDPVEAGMGTLGGPWFASHFE